MCLWECVYRCAVRRGVSGLVISVDYGMEVTETCDVIFIGNDM